LKIKYDAAGHAVDAQYNMPTTAPQSLSDGGPVTFRDEELKRAIENAMRDGNLPNPWDLGGPPGPVAVPSAMFIGTMPGPGGLGVPIIMQGPTLAVPGPITGPVTATLAQPAATSAPKGVEYEFKGDEDPGFTPKPSWWQKVKDWFRKGYRYVDDAEKAEIEQTGRIPNVNQKLEPKDIHITLDKLNTKAQVDAKLKPPTEKKWRVEFQMRNVKDRTAFTEVKDPLTKTGTGGTEARTGTEIADQFTFVALE